MKKTLLFIACLSIAFSSVAQNHNLLINNELKNTKNSISLSLFNPLNGEIPLFYQRDLTPKLSAELGVGVTKWFDVMVGSMLCSNTFQGYAVEKSKLGVFLAPSLKYYPFGQNKGFHISAGMLYKRFNYNILDNENKIKNAYRSDFDKARLAIGYTEQWGNFTGEFQIGAAQRNTFKTPVAQNNEGYFSDSENKKSGITGFISCKIGYRF
jgi:hypothetical protein